LEWIDGLLGPTFRGSTIIETPINICSVGRSSSVVSQIDGLIDIPRTIRVLDIAGGGELAVKGTNVTSQQ
jgi:hypothetical protein